MEDWREEQAAEATETSAETTEDTVTEENPAESAETAEAEQAEVIDEELSGEADKPEKKGLFGKKPKKDKKDEQIEELTDRVKRQMAEFDNFRKRTEKEKAAMYEVGARSVIEKILPVVDNFERGLAAADENSEDPMVQGMFKIYKQLMTTLEGMDVKPIDATGKEFDPNFHNAVMHVDDENLGENVVAEELMKGYMYRDTVVRHSMVKVAN